MNIGLENISQYDLYQDEAQNEQTFPNIDKDLESMTDVEEHYIEAGIVLSREDQIARGHVVTKSHYANEILWVECG